MTTRLNPIPGWYADPVAQGTLRWWDGQRWTAAQQPLRPPPPPVKVPEHAGRNERLGRLTVLAQVIGSVLLAGTYGYLAPTIVNDFSAWLRDLQTTPVGEPAPLPASSLMLSLLLLMVIAPLGWVPLMALVVWTYRCATAAAALRIPATREPLWAAVGWFVPVLSYWFPYQSIRDCLPPDHPERRTVGRWWALYLVTSHGPLVVAAIALAAGTVPFLIAWIVHAGLAVTEVVLALGMVRAIDAAHREALETPDR